MRAPTQQSTSIRHKGNIIVHLCIGVFLSLIATTTQASLITETFEITLTTGGGPYNAGHVFNMTATYDNEGTVMHTWNDGPNQIAEFGAPGSDDTVWKTRELGGLGPRWTFYSDALITITGLAPLPTGATRRDTLNRNWMRATTYVSEKWGEQIDFNKRGDGEGFYLTYYRNKPGVSDFFHRIDYNDSLGEHQYDYHYHGYNVPTVAGVSQEVPEPTTLSLLSIGLAGLGITRRLRKA